MAIEESYSPLRKSVTARIKRLWGEYVSEVGLEGEDLANLIQQRPSNGASPAQHEDQAVKKVDQLRVTRDLLRTEWRKSWQDDKLKR